MYVPSSLAKVAEAKNHNLGTKLQLFWGVCKKKTKKIQFSTKTVKIVDEIIEIIGDNS